MAGSTICSRHALRKPRDNTAYPNLAATVTGLVNRLEVEPLTTTLNDPATGEELKIVVDGGALVDWIRDQSRTNTQLTRVPALLDELAHGSQDALAAIAMYRIQLAPRPSPNSPSTSFGLAYGVGCREQFATYKDIGAAGWQAFPYYPASIRDQAVSTWAYANDDCTRVWKVPTAPANVRRLLVSSIPTLLIFKNGAVIDRIVGAHPKQTLVERLNHATSH